MFVDEMLKVISYIYLPRLGSNSQSALPYSSLSSTDTSPRT